VLAFQLFGSVCYVIVFFMLYVMIIIYMLLLLTGRARRGLDPQRQRLCLWCLSEVPCWEFRVRKKTLFIWYVEEYVRTDDNRSKLAV